jgi:uncharacterized protein
MWIPRNLEKIISQISETRPAVLLTGVRQSGKTTLLKNMFPHAVYVSLDRLLVAQNAPHLFRELKIKSSL